MDTKIRRNLALIFATVGIALPFGVSHFDQDVKDETSSLSYQAASPQFPGVPVHFTNLRTVDPAGLSSMITAQVNGHRMVHGKKSVNQASDLDASAQQWADHLARTGEFYHDSDGRSMCSHGFWHGENIAVTFRDQPERAFGMWVGSPGHNANLLGGGYREVGHGVAIYQTGKYKGQPIVVQRFRLEHSCTIPDAPRATRGNLGLLSS
ncbi:MAG: CAP domain-containing protein [Corynebacterium sp.]|uniref:CAP domain-containing protein n=1 Tax=Corynebacterium sp. TaxID=1720 RepID=UPI0026DCD771|nr:CAP domain-containing protein [Corynebacterium sp.]MDO4760294.1 CAP domain-containing protein [Corynebacterium sp.]